MVPLLQLGTRIKSSVAVRSHAGAVGPGFHLVHDNALMPLTGPHVPLDLNSVENLLDIMYRSIRCCCDELHASWISL